MNLLSVPKIQSVRYDRNFIDSAVCELRIPTLLELNSTPPSALQKALRSKYPRYDIEESVDANGNIKRRYLFSSSNKAWVASLRDSALALETNEYTQFSDFYSRLQELLDICRDTLDTTFFTRVGLRYINQILIDDGDISGWINPILITTILEDSLGDKFECLSTIAGPIENGTYIFRYGTKSVVQGDTATIKNFMLDFDYAKYEVDYNDALELISKFNETNFSFFSWAIDTKAKKWLGDGRNK